MAHDYDTSVTIFNSLLVHPIPDSFKAEILHRKGIIFLSRGVEDSALYYEKKALDIFTDQMNFSKMSRVQGNISRLYSSQRIYDQALEYNLSALSSARLAVDSLRQYLNLCELYLAQGNYRDLYDVLIHHIDRFAKGLLSNQDFLTSSNFGLYFANKDQRDSALHYFKRALTEALSGQDSSAAYNNISDEYRLIKNYPLAIEYLDSALQINRKAGNLQSQLASCETFVEIYTETHDYRNALTWSESGRRLSDSIFKNGKANALLEADVKYQAAKKEAANILLAKDITIQQRNLIFSLTGLGMVALLAALIFRSYRQKRKANLVLTTQKNELQHLAHQLELANQTKLLLLSTIGHDLRSPLSSLYALLKVQEIKGSQDNAGSPVMSSQIIGLLNILENLLAWSKLKLFDTELIPLPARVNLHELFTEQADFFIPDSVKKNIQILNETPEDLYFPCDEYILGTILRNSIGNAMNNAETGKPVILMAQYKMDNACSCMVQNVCSQVNFEHFQRAFNNATIQSGGHGLGLVLIKEFARIINASVSLAYADGRAIMNISL